MTDYDMRQFDKMEQFIKAQFAEESKGVPEEQLALAPDADPVRRLEWLRKGKAEGGLTPKSSQSVEDEEQLSDWAQMYTVTTPAESGVKSL